MITLLAAATLAVLGAPQDNRQLLGAEFEKIRAAQPVTSGYRDYMDAALKVRQLKLERFLRPEEPGSTLVKGRKARAEFGPVLALIQSGNRKGGERIMLGDGLLELFPEYAYFKSMAKLAMLVAHAEFAEGTTGKGAELCESIVRMSSAIKKGPLIGYLVGTACDTIVYAEIERSLPRLKIPDLVRLETVAELGLDIKSVQSSLRAEFGFMNHVLDQLFAAAKGQPPLSDAYRELLEDEASKAQIELIRSLAPNEQTELRARLQRRITDYVDRLTAQIEKPESQWQAILPESQSELDMILDDTLPLFEGTTWVVARTRTQARLLRLHARIQSYRWEDGQLPTESAITPASLWDDPLTGKKFVYKPIGPDSYELYSEGVTQTGRIDLRYVRPPESTQAQSDDEPASP